MIFLNLSMQQKMSINTVSLVELAVTGLATDGDTQSSVSMFLQVLK